MVQSPSILPTCEKPPISEMFHLACQVKVSGFVQTQNQFSKQNVGSEIFSHKQQTKSDADETTFLTGQTVFDGELFTLSCRLFCIRPPGGVQLCPDGSRLRYFLSVSVTFISFTRSPGRPCSYPTFPTSLLTFCLLTSLSDITFHPVSSISPLSHNSAPTNRLSLATNKELKTL